MGFTGIDALTYGVDDMAECIRFFGDWGLSKVEATDERAVFETQDGSQVIIRPAGAPDLPAAIEDGPTLRRAIWGMSAAAAVESLVEKLKHDASFGIDDGLPSVTDPNGLRLSFRVTRRRPTQAPTQPMNTAAEPDARRNTRAPVYDQARPVSIGHFVMFTPNVNTAVAYYTDTLGFVVSDYYPDAGYFLRCSPEGGHHNLFLLETPDKKRGLNHVAFTVRDIHEVFGGGLHISKCGWETQIGPGRHPISSAYFWYVHNPAGALAEYYADEDWCEADWPVRAWERTPEHYAEWAVAGGIDAKTRRQAKSK